MRIAKYSFLAAAGLIYGAAAVEAWQVAGSIHLLALQVLGAYAIYNAAYFAVAVEVEEAHED
jgi:hypothetical protein